SFAKRAHIVMMGGALTVPGNVSPWAEANVNQDPEATDLLFRRAQDVTMIGLDVTLQTLLTYAETKKWRELGTRGGDFLAEATDYYIK
ncbi:nucleoside hydrolase, partial [Staphylococcus aureus]|nr:nucleoside hydrolase [Staphylococcus aureus]